MAIKVIEGVWEDVAHKVTLTGRKVRVVVPDSPDGVVTLTEAPRDAVAARADNGSWLKQLIEFSNSRTPPKQTIDIDPDRVFRELHG